MFDYQLSPDYRFLNFKDIKKGSKLLVKSLKWYKENKEESCVHIGATFVSDMAKFCGKIVTVERFYKDTFEPEDYGIYDNGCEDASIYKRRWRILYLVFRYVSMYKSFKKFGFGVNMKVKIIRKKNGKTETKYVANDGLEFKNKESCVFYERKYMWRNKW